MIDEDQIRQLVRRVVYRTVGRDGADAAPTGRRLVTAADVQDVPAGGNLKVPDARLVTPLARQAALERKVRIVEEQNGVSTDGLGMLAGEGKERVVALGADHGGYELKDLLVEHVRGLGYTAVDCGTNGPESVDYPDIALAVARLVADGRAWRGILVDGAGIGSCIAANKVHGIRAAMCYDEATAVNSREHNHANILTLGAGLIGQSLARQMVATWLETPAGGGRHKRRVDMIMDMESGYGRSRGELG